MRLRPVFGNEGLFDNDVLAAGAPKAGNVPVVFDSILIGHEQERTKIANLVSPDLACAGNRAQHHAAAMVATRRERPPSGNLVATRNFFGFAGRIVRRGVHGRGIVAPHLLLRFFSEETELPRMDSDNACNPAGRRRRTRDLGRRVDELDQGNFAAAEARRLQRSQETAVQQELPGGIAQAPQLVIFGRVGRKQRRDPFRLFNQAHRNMTRLTFPCAARRCCRRDRGSTVDGPRPCSPAPRGTRFPFP